MHYEDAFWVSVHTMNVILAKFNTLHTVSM